MRQCESWCETLPVVAVADCLLTSATSSRIQERKNNTTATIILYISKIIINICLNILTYTLRSNSNLYNLRLLIITFDLFAADRSYARTGAINAIHSKMAQTNLQLFELNLRRHHCEKSENLLITTTLQKFIFRLTWLDETDLEVPLGVEPPSTLIPVLFCRGHE